METRRSRRKPEKRVDGMNRSRRAARAAKEAMERSAEASDRAAAAERKSTAASDRTKAVSSGKKKESNFVIQGSILAVAGIIVRLIGMLYRIPMTNIIGDEGMGYYSTAFNVYNIMLILSSYSLPLAVSKMVAVRMAKGQYRNVNRVLYAALVYATIAGGVACFITWNFAEFFAVSVFATPFCIYALKTLAPTIWIMAYLGVLRGFFQGHGTMIPTAMSQIFEQIVNAIISVIAASVLFKVGLDSNKVYGTTGYPEAFGAAGGTIGTGAGALTALLFLLFLYVLFRPTVTRRMRRDRSGCVDSYGEISRTFVVTVIPVILSSAVYNINSVIDNGIMAHGFEMLGRGDEFLALWGIYNNKYMLLVHVPLAIANSLSSSLIPSLSGAMAKKDRKAARAKTGLAIRFAMMIAIPSAVGLTVLSAPINNLLFRSTDNTEAIRMLIIGSVAVVFLSLSTVTNAILQGINRMNVPVRNALISLVLHVMVLYVMLMGLKMGIYSMVFANIFFAVCMCLLNAWAIRKEIRYRQELTRTFFIPAVAAAIMGVAAFLTYRVVTMVIKSNLLGTVVSVSVAVAVYGVLLIRLRGIEEQELKSMPGGTRLFGLCRKLHLM